MLLRSVRHIKKGAIGRWRMGGRVIVTGGTGDSHMISGGDLSVWSGGWIRSSRLRRWGGAIRGGI